MIIILILILLLLLYWCITSRENFQTEEIKINSYQDCGKCCYESDNSRCWYYDKNNQKKYCSCQNQESKTQNDCIKCCNENMPHKCFRYGRIKDNLTQIYCDCPRFIKN
jgi:hypothetical protein